jgi:hypothetical protein
MLRSTRISLLRPLAATGLLATAAITAPGAVWAQTSADAALLNRAAPTTYVSSALSLVWTGRPWTGSSSIDGEVVLLARTSAPLGYPQFVDAAVEAAPVSGAYALLGRRNPLEPARRQAAQR